MSRVRKHLLWGCAFAMFLLALEVNGPADRVRDRLERHINRMAWQAIDAALSQGHRQ
jgi:hypothetical protein